MFTLKCRAFLQFESEFECLIIWFIWMHCLYTYFKFAVGKKKYICTSYKTYTNRRFGCRTSRQLHIYVLTEFFLTIKRLGFDITFYSSTILRNIY